MTNLRDEMKQEAISRMVNLHLHPTVINEFKDKGKRYVSIGGFVHFLDDSQLKKVLQFEEETDCMVYHVIYNSTTIADMLTFLYVSNNLEDWEIERKSLTARTPLAYVVNLNDNVFSEFGSVRIQEHLGGLIRIG